jgi:hypothetical protein
MKGGVILTRGGTLVDGVLHMIVHGTLSLVTNDSAYGVIFRIDCVDTPFMGMDHQPITSICLKMCVLQTPSERTIGGNEKFSVSLEEFVHEVKLQQDIFVAVSTTSDEKVCPGIIVAMIDEQIPTPPEPTFFQRMLHRFGIQSIKTVETLLQKLSTMKGDPYARRLIQELIATKLPIGMIAMEMIPNSTTLRENKTYKLCASAIAKLVRIFFRTDERGVVGTVHCDCHLGNVLINPSGAIIIDFGRTVDRYTPFTAEQQATFETKWGEPLSTVYDRCCAFDEILFEPRTRGKDNGLKQLEELLNFFIFMDSLKNERMRRKVIQMNSLLSPFVMVDEFMDDDIMKFERQEFSDHYCKLILEECRRSRKIDLPHSGAEIRKLQAVGRVFTGEPTKKLRGEPLSEVLPEPRRYRDQALRPMSANDKHVLFTQLTQVYGLTDEKAHEIVDLNPTSLYDLVAEALTDPSNRRGGNNKRIKNVSKRSTASHHHATRRHSSQRKKSGTLRRVQR